MKNIPRMLPDGMTGRDRKEERAGPADLPASSEGGEYFEHDMFNTFNMGTGLCIAVASDKADGAPRSERGGRKRPFCSG